MLWESVAASVSPALEEPHLTEEALHSNGLRNLPPNLLRLHLGLGSDEIREHRNPGLLQNRYLPPSRPGGGTVPLTLTLTSLPAHMPRREDVHYTSTYVVDNYRKITSYLYYTANLISYIVSMSTRAPLLTF